MYGMSMLVTHPKITIELIPFKKEFLPTLVAGFSSMRVHMHTNQTFAQVLENEQEWYDRTRKDGDIVSWAIRIPGAEMPIGVTALHDIKAIDGSCKSGIIIWDQAWWGKGVASAAHLGRTLFAADTLNRCLIRTSVRSDNAASRKALERVGYYVWGTEPMSGFRQGKYISTDHLLWLHPDRRDLFYARGVYPPQVIDTALYRAKTALDQARTVVAFP